MCATARPLHLWRGQHDVLRLWPDGLRQDLHHDGDQWWISAGLIPVSGIWYHKSVEPLRRLLSASQFLWNLLRQTLRPAQQTSIAPVPWGWQAESQYCGPHGDQCDLCRGDHANDGFRSLRADQWYHRSQCGFKQVPCCSSVTTTDK